jgi:hypothetical protein
MRKGRRKLIEAVIAGRFISNVNQWARMDSKLSLDALKAKRDHAVCAPTATTSTSSALILTRTWRGIMSSSYLALYSGRLA